MQGITAKNPFHGTRGTLLLAAALLPLGACVGEGMSEESGSAPAAAEGVRTFYGETVPIGEGTARTYLMRDAGGTLELGVALSEGAFEKLPEGHDHGHGPMAEYLLPLPPQAASTPYEFVELNWNRLGHTNSPYALPHFDFHFYTIPLTERNAIDQADPQYVQKARNLLPPEQTPPNYVVTSTLAGVSPEVEALPRMGMHWVDTTSPEFNGQTFTTTFIYGSWDGKIIFTEPMVTRALLESKPDLRLPIPVPQRYSKPGSYPTAYRIYWDAQSREYRVSLIDFVRRS